MKRLGLLAAYIAVGYFAIICGSAVTAFFLLENGYIFELLRWRSANPRGGSSYVWHKERGAHE